MDFCNARVTPANSEADIFASVDAHPRLPRAASNVLRLLAKGRLAEAACAYNYNPGACHARRRPIGATTTTTAISNPTGTIATAALISAAASVRVK